MYVCMYGHVYLILNLGGTSESQWEDVTGSTPLTFMNDTVSFTTTVSARFWLMDCRNIGAVPKMATELYEESLFVPYITKYVPALMLPL